MLPAHKNSNDKPRMVDLFCGRGGWTKGFQAHGWHCIGIDLYPQPDYPGEEFIQADIAHLTELPPADFYCCSSPCEQFSVHGMKHFHPNPKWPWLGLALFGHSRQLLEATGKPFVMENVRPAQKFVGKNDYQFGPFALWGNCFASMWPWPAYELVRLKKGYDMGKSSWDRKTNMDYARSNNLAMAFSSKSKERREITARAAEIPESLSSHIALMAGAR